MADQRLPVRAAAGSMQGRLMCSGFRQYPARSVLGLVATGGVASLADRMRTSRTLLRTTLAALARRDLVMRRSPRVLAVDYGVTPESRRVARAAERPMFGLHRRRIYDVARRTWCLPTLLVIHEFADRFNQLKTCLPGITARA